MSWPKLLSLEGSIAATGGSTGELKQPVGTSPLLIYGGTTLVANAAGRVNDHIINLHDRIKITSLNIDDNGLLSSGNTLQMVHDWLNSPKFLPFVVPSGLEIKFAYTHVQSSLTGTDFPYVVSIVLFGKQLTQLQYERILNLEKSAGSVDGLMGMSGIADGNMLHDIAGAVTGLKEVVSAFNGLLSGGRSNGVPQQFNSYR